MCEFRGRGAHETVCNTTFLSFSRNDQFCPSFPQEFPLVPLSTENQAIPLESGPFSEGGHLILTPLTPREKMDETALLTTVIAFTEHLLCARPCAWHCSELSGQLLPARLQGRH